MADAASSICAELRGRIAGQRTETDAAAVITSWSTLSVANVSRWVRSDLKRSVKLVRVVVRSVVSAGATIIGSPLPS